MVHYSEFTRVSLNGEGELFCRSWVPEQPRAILQIAHGMSEHSGRYQRIGQLLAENGYAVYMNDHAGHGRSRMDHPGTFALGGHGFDFVLGDMKMLFDYARAEHPELPCILMGHSMGSILAGIYGNSWGAELDGLILLGTPSPNRLSALGAMLARSISRRRGATYVSTFLRRMTGQATSGKPDAPELERKQWLSSNQENILAYINDPYGGVEFSASATAELCKGLAEFGSSDWGKNVPAGLPVLLMAGERDRGGGNGRAPLHYRDQLLKYGVEDVTLYLASGARHEILNEVDTQQTDAVLLSWLARRF